MLQVFLCFRDCFVFWCVLYCLCVFGVFVFSAFFDGKIFFLIVFTFFVIFLEFVMLFHCFFSHGR